MNSLQFRSVRIKKLLAEERGNDDDPAKEEKGEEVFETRSTAQSPGFSNDV